jgi:predicted DNA-binding transcriptional regulator YafY
MVQEMMTSNGIIKETLQRDLDRLSEANIPVDIVFEQGLDVLGID